MGTVEPVLEYVWFGLGVIHYIVFFMFSNMPNPTTKGVKTRRRKAQYQDEVDKDDCFGCFQPCSYGHIDMY